MKIFFATKFTEYFPMTLISIGLISEAGISFYAELTDYDEKHCNEQTKKDILECLHTRYPGYIEKSEYVPNLHVGNCKDIGKALCIWLKQFDYAEFVCDRCTYDFVLLMNMFGGANWIPNNVCPVCYDLNQDIAKTTGLSLREAYDIPRKKLLYEAYKENSIKARPNTALYDAKTIRLLYQIVNNVHFD
jgi:hypothetical protein